MIRYLTVVMAAVAIMAGAQERITVCYDDGDPVVGAAVFDNQERVLETTDCNGVFTAPDANLFPLHIKALGLIDTYIQAPTATVRMAASPVALSEIVVDNDKRPILKLTCLLKETSGFTTTTDTMSIKGEYMVEFYLPMKKVKKFKAIKEPLVRAERVAYRNTVKDQQDLDKDMLSFKDVVSLKYKPFNEKESLKAKASGTDTTFAKKTGRPERIFRKSPHDYTMRIDQLANEKNGIMSPNVLKIFGLTMDFTQLLATYQYEPSDSGMHSISDMTGMTLSFEVTGKGKLIKKFLNTKDDVDIYGYLELIPLDREFLTVEDAKEQSKASYKLPFPENK